MSTSFRTQTHFDLKSPSERIMLSGTDLRECPSTIISLDEIDLGSESSSSISATPDAEYAHSVTEESSPSEYAQDETCQTETLQNAVIVTSERALKLVSDFPVPESLGAQEVMIRNYATGLNHIDWKSVDYNMCLPQLPWVLGREMAGVVEQVGSEVTRLQRGDRVWTSTYYKDRRAGCFQDLVVVPEHTVLPIPSTIDFNEAACLGVAALTAGMSMWRWLQIPMSPPAGQTPDTAPVMLIWGGSTVTGQFAIQYAAHAGYEVIAVCSASTSDLVSSLGATHVVSYTGKTDLHIIGEILCLARGRLTKAIDLVGAQTAKLVLQVIGACGPSQIVEFAPLAFMARDSVVPGNARVHNVEMKQFVLDSESHVYGARLNELLEAKMLRLPVVQTLEGGLAAVEEGLRKVKEGHLKGEKLVVSLRS